MAWNVLVISLSFLLLVFLLWKELKRTNRFSLAARLIATSISVLSMTCIALPLTVTRRLSSAGINSAVLLTDGYFKDSLQKFLQANPGKKIFTLDKNIKTYNATYIPDLSLLSEDSSNISSIHVFGYGLNKYDLDLLNDLPVTFHPAAIQNRITSIDWNTKLTSGDKLVVQGSFNNITSDPVKIILNGFDTNLDSVMLPANRSSNFELSAFPRHIDKAVYSIITLKAGDTLEKNPLPVEVEVAKTLSILVLASSPDFENKFLKNWLTENEYRFAVRTSISKNKYDKQYLNTGFLSLDRISLSLLDKFDIVIADLSELNNLPSADISNLRSQIENKGMGLVVKAGNAQRTSGFYLSSFPLTETRDSVYNSVKLDGGSISFSKPLRIEQPVYIKNMPGTESLIRDQQARILVSNKMVGFGKIVVTTVPNAYAWWLNGNKEDYATYWSTLLKKAARKSASDHSWETQSGLARVNHKIDLSLQTASGGAQGLQFGSEMMYPHQNYLLPYEWRSTHWPKRSGWQMLTSADTSASWTYVYNNEEWSGLLASEKYAVTKKYERSISLQIADDISVKQIRVQIPKEYFAILFILSVTFLWIEKKYRNG